MRPSYDPIALSVPDEEVRVDRDQCSWRGQERFTGFIGETLDGGVYEFQSYRDGWLDGPSGQISPDGDLIEEEWYQGNHLHGITREFRQDGTLATATGYRYGYPIWIVRFDFDGSTVLSTDRPEPVHGQPELIDILGSKNPLPPLRGPEDAADLSKH
ncbi:hypothetical protein LO763_24505 [Glycomyces sp. A-F 0318]|uniref:toxin-antitoxin system YwqK family antitoxin n=1 Tax=Glycomyces amatae TaxID=2881355 RepID=UPI001E4736E4|nr:hypothetical protein [Glycomyces amatae]MCD0446784.1 hypothetical protein [Glycomyces amatae]